MNLFKRTAIAASVALSLLGSALSLPAAHAASYADLTITTVEHYKMGNGDESLRYTIKNQGLVSAPASKLFISGTGGTKLSETRDVPSLAPGASVSLFHYPGLTTDGMFKRTAKVDSSSIVPESNESNNQREEWAWYAARPDMKPTTMTPTCGASNDHKLRFTVRNNGWVPTGAFSIKVWGTSGLNTEEIIQVPSMMPGEVRSFVHDPKDTTNNWVRKVMTDNLGYIGEFNELNNSATMDGYTCIPA